MLQMRRTVPTTNDESAEEAAPTLVKFQHSAGRAHWLATKAVRGGNQHGSACRWRIVISPKIPQDSPSCYDSLMRNLRVEETTTGGRCPLAVSAVSSFGLDPNVCSCLLPLITFLASRCDYQAQIIH
jgi:hypothetical protein